MLMSSSLVFVGFASQIGLSFFSAFVFSFSLISFRSEGDACFMNDKEAI